MVLVRGLKIFREGLRELKDIQKQRDFRTCGGPREGNSLFLAQFFSWCLAQFFRCSQKARKALSMAASSGLAFASDMACGLWPSGSFDHSLPREIAQVESLDLQQPHLLHRQIAAADPVLRGSVWLKQRGLTRTQTRACLPRPASRSATSFPRLATTLRAPRIDLSA